MALISCAILSLLGAYHDVMERPGSWHRYCSAVAAAAAGVGLLGVVAAWHLGISRATVVLGSAVLFVGLRVTRSVLVFLHHKLLPTKTLWVIAESSAEARRLAEKVRSAESRFEVRRSSTLPADEELSEAIADFDAVLCTPAVRAEVEAGCRAANRELLIVPEVEQIRTVSARTKMFDDLAVLSLPKEGGGRTEAVLQRSSDIAAAALIGIVMLPVMAMIALLVWMDSAGGVLFRQERRGLDGKKFEMLKFRTMIAGAENASGAVLASSEDRRITRAGRWLRSTRLDELPQLWNVIRGDMRLVGPRPEREELARGIEEKVPDFCLRTMVKPGLTGLAQVYGSYTTSAEDKLRLDVLYITKASLRLDLQIMLMTLRVALQRERARGVPVSPILELTVPSHTAIDKRQNA
jgi:exopolysaccharide biosynthesis polyprenyl glycosylphosphotransferase